MRNFLISVSITFANPKILGFLFLRKIVIGRNCTRESVQTTVQSLLVVEELAR